MKKIFEIAMMAGLVCCLLFGGFAVSAFSADSREVVSPKLFNEKLVLTITYYDGFPVSIFIGLDASDGTSRLANFEVKKFGFIASVLYSKKDSANTWQARYFPESTKEDEAVGKLFLLGDSLANEAGKDQLRRNFYKFEDSIAEVLNEVYPSLELRISIESISGVKRVIGPTP